MRSVRIGPSHPLPIDPVPTPVACIACGSALDGDGKCSRACWLRRSARLNATTGAE